MWSAWAVRWGRRRQRRGHRIRDGRLLRDDRLRSEGGLRGWGLGGERRLDRQWDDGANAKGCIGWMGSGCAAIVCGIAA